jgi:hypothetical protein
MLDLTVTIVLGLQRSIPVFAGMNDSSIVRVDII